MVEGIEIRAAGFYDEQAVSKRFGIRASEQRRARESGDLKFAKKGSQILYRGDWLLTWLAPSEVAS